MHRCGNIYRRKNRADAIDVFPDPLVVFEHKNSDIKRVMKRLIISTLLCIAGIAPAFGYKILYAEQFYKLFHAHFYQYPDDSLENIYYLEQALRADFANPLNALARIENKVQWERYRYLFYMHVNLKLVDQYLRLGVKYDKMVAYFYNAPWKKENLESLKKAEQAYQYALEYWKEALVWSAKAYQMRMIHLEEIQYWEDENFRIETGDLDYGTIIDGHLIRLTKVRTDFESMDRNTY